MVEAANFADDLSGSPKKYGESAKWNAA